MKLNRTELQRLLSAPHPQPMAAACAALKQGKRSAFAAEQLTLLAQRGEQYLSEPFPALPYTLFAEYWATGDRAAFQRPYFERRGRLLTFSVLAWLHPEDARYRNALTDCIWEICAEPFWALPAHFLDADGEPLPCRCADYETLLDLFACETACGLAQALSLTADQLPEIVVEQATRQIDRRCLTPFLEGKSIYRFEGMRNNWSGVCASAIGITGLYCLKDTARLASLLLRCAESVEVYLGSFGADGICTEGVDYWSYGFGFFTCFATLLAERTNGKIDYFADPQYAKVQAIAAGQPYFYVSGGASLSFSDGSEHSRYRAGVTQQLHRRLGTPVPPRALAADILSDSCYRYCTALADLVWSRDEDFGTAPAATGAVYLPDAQWFLAPNGQDCLAARAGNNGESHNHNDCGSFILYRGGHQVLADLGAGLYDAAYFGPDRYQIFVNRSASHNLPLLNGQEQLDGTEYHATAVKADSLNKTFSMELAGCWPGGTVQSFERAFRVENGVFVLSDVFQFATPGQVTESFCAREPITLGEGQATFQREGQSVRLFFDAAIFTPELREESYTAPDGRNTPCYLLRLHAKPTRVLAVQFRFE